jgi:IMP dehydrogenase
MDYSDSPLKKPKLDLTFEDMTDGLSLKELFKKNKGTGLTYDDLILLPGFINFTVDDVKLKSRISRNI